MERTHSKYPSLNKESKQLVDNLPLNSKGVHRVSINDDKILLTLVYGDLKDSLLDLKNTGGYDAWFLDGFSPNKNPDMWSKEIIGKIAKASNSSTTFATYSVAGVVKRNLIEAKFKITKNDGFGTKREMLTGLSESSALKKEFKKKRIGIIGAGIAGCSLAAILAKRGHQVTVFEKESSAASLASGNPILVTYPRLSAYDSPYARFSIGSFLFSSKFYDRMNSKFWKKSGVLMLNFNEYSNKRENDLCQARDDEELFTKLDRHQATQKSGISVKYGGLYFKDAGYIEPESMCNEILKHENITANFMEKVNSVESLENLKKISTTRKDYDFDEICFCTAHDVDKFFDLKGISKKRGQVTLIKTNSTLSKLKFPICAGGYFSPNINENHLAGSSYSNIDSSEILAEEHEEILEKMTEIHEGKMDIIGGRVGFRTVTKDRAPIAGHLNDFYLNVGHGSRGSTSAPLCSQYIADLIDNKPVPIDSEVEKMLSPERFIIKTSE